MTRAVWAVFLLGSSSYLPGVLVLAHTLRKYKSRFPLIVLVNDKVPVEARKLLQEYGLEVRVVEALLPTIKITSIAERFIDTWTKVQVFGLIEYDKVVLIDGDMMLRRNMDELFELDLPPDWVACAWGCICNLDKSWWAPKRWTREACGYTALRHPSALTAPAPPENPPSREPYLVNSGLVVLKPSRELHQRFIDLMSTKDPEEAAEVGSWMFPDQDFIGHVFADKWLSLPWVYNGIKISRFWHANLWRDEYCANVHYICDKPWKQPPMTTPDGKLDVGIFAEPTDAIVEGQGSDAVTHTWWWREYFDMSASLSSEARHLVDTLVVPPDAATEHYIRHVYEPKEALPIPDGWMDKPPGRRVAMND